MAVVSPKSDQKTEKYPSYSAEDFIEWFGQLKAERSNLDQHMQMCAKFCIPRKATITVSKTPGQLFDYDVYDSVGIDSNNIMAAGFHSYMTNPSSEWFQLRISKPELNENSDVKLWLKTCQDRIYNALNNSNFPQQIHEVYLDMGCMGTATLYEEEDPKSVIRFYARPIQEIFVVEDAEERIDTVFRTFSLSVKQAYAQWGDKAGKHVVDAFANKKYNDKLEFLHVVMPRYVREAGKKDKQNMPFTSTYVSMQDKVIIEDGGYEEMPFFVVRFYKNSGETYGSSVAMVALANLKMLMDVSKTIIRGAQKQVDPPLLFPHDGYVMPIKLYSGAINFKTETETPGEEVEVLYKGGNLPIGFELQDRYKQAIQRSFFVDLFLLLSQREDMTATEVLQRVEEKMLILAPALGRLMSELLNPIIYRTFNIMMRAGLLPPPPDVLEGEDYIVEYISPLARAQKLDQIKDINNFINIIGAISERIPDVVHKVDADEIVNDAGNIYNINPKIIRSNEAAGKIRQAIMQAQEQANQLAMMQQRADVAQKAVGAYKTGKEADVVGATAGAGAQ